MSNDVTVIDRSTKTVVMTIPVGMNPVGAWPGVDDVMYVDCEDSRTVVGIDSKSLAVGRTYDLGFMPGMAATPPGGGDLWVTDTTNGKVVFFSTATGMKTGEATTGAGAHAIAFSADGKLAYVTNQAADTVSTLDVQMHVVKGSVRVGSKPNGILFRMK